MKVAIKVEPLTIRQIDAALEALRSRIAGEIDEDGVPSIEAYKGAQRKLYQARRELRVKAKLKITPEEKARWTAMLQNTWSAIGHDAEPGLERGRQRVPCIIEMTLDANRPEEWGDMTSEEYETLCDLYSRRDQETMRWLRAVLNY